MIDARTTARSPPTAGEGFRLPTRQHLGAQTAPIRPVRARKVSARLRQSHPDMATILRRMTVEVVSSVSVEISHSEAGLRLVTAPTREPRLATVPIVSV